MKKITFLSLLLLPALLFARNLTFDKAHTKVGFKIKYLMFSHVYGNFNDFNGKIDYDEKKKKANSIQVTIKSKSISTNHTKRDKDLRSPNFFDVKKYPTITFVLSKPQKLRKGKRTALKGTLTMHGTSKKVVLNTIYYGKVKDPMGNLHFPFKASTVLNRKDFGLTWNKALESGGLLVGEKVTIEIEGQLVVSK